jgi:hypothetical protein
MRRRRVTAPELLLWERAKKRALDRGVPFAIDKRSIVVPRFCPVLGIPIKVGQARSINSPSLDRIIPREGYVPGNVRVVSDKANRMKGNLSLWELRLRAEHGPKPLRRDYQKVAEYVEREALLAEVRSKAAKGGRAGKEWAKIAAFLERIFSRGIDEPYANDNEPRVDHEGGA